MAADVIRAWRWWRARRELRIPTHYCDGRRCFELKPLPLVPLLPYNHPARASFDEVHHAPALGWARLKRYEGDGDERVAVYRSSIGLRRSVPSGDWRNRGRGLELAAIALIPRNATPGFAIPRTGLP